MDMRRGWASMGPPSALELWRPDEVCVEVGPPWGLHPFGIVKPMVFEPRRPRRLGTYNTKIRVSVGLHSYQPASAWVSATRAPEFQSKAFPKSPLPHTWVACEAVCGEHCYLF